jgi:hypothetical protein
VRASEVEREAVVDELRRHAAVGRLDVDELEQRIDAALAARTLDELAELKRDLPTPPQSDFGEHLRVYAAVQLLLVAIWAVTGAGYFWPVWPFMGWGIGLVLHGVCDAGKERSWASGSTRAPRRRAIAS